MRGWDPPAPSLLPSNKAVSIPSSYHRPTVEKIHGKAERAGEPLHAQKRKPSVCMLTLLLLFSCSLVTLSAAPWTVDCQASLSKGFPKQKWVVISFSRGPSPTQGSNSRLLHRRWVLYHQATWEAPGLLCLVPHKVKGGSITPSQLSYPRPYRNTHPSQARGTLQSERCFHDCSLHRASL